MQLKAAQILTVLLRCVSMSSIGCRINLWTSAEKYPLQPQQLQPFLNTLAVFITNNSSHKRDVAVQCLEAVLPRPEVRKAVWANAPVVLG